MATTATSNLILSLVASLKDTTKETKTASHMLEVNETRAAGAGAAQVDAVYSNLDLELAATPTTLDLQSLTDSFGDALSLQKIFVIWIQNTSTTATEVIKVGAAATNIWEPFVAATGDIVQIDPNGDFVWRNGTGATVDATNKDLKLDPSADTITVKILIIGTKS